VRTPAKVLANNISELKFKLVGNVLEIKITAQKQTTQNYPVSAILETKVKLRN
jgi:hypothetical protein